VVQTLPSLQFGGVPALQSPARQVSAPLHALPSLHEVPFAAWALLHTPALQTSIVHGLPSLQLALIVHD
jgi:hypothetical protein